LRRLDLLSGIDPDHVKPRARLLPPNQISRYYDGALAPIVPSVCYETFGIILTSRS
jgi:hypothetical protein